MLYAPFIEDLEDRKRRDLLHAIFELEVMKLFVSDVSKLLFSLLSPLGFVANNISEGINVVMLNYFYFPQSIYYFTIWFQNFILLRKHCSGRGFSSFIKYLYVKFEL